MLLFWAFFISDVRSFQPGPRRDPGGDPDRQRAPVGQDQAPATTSARSAGGLTIMRGTSYRSTELASGGRCRVSPRSTGYTDTSCPAAQASPSGTERRMTTYPVV